MCTFHFDCIYQALAQEIDYQEGRLGYIWLVDYKNEIQISHGFGLYVDQISSSSNVAEYLALLDGLEAQVDSRVVTKVIEVRGDAKSVINQMQELSSISSFPFGKLHNVCIKDGILLAEATRRFLIQQSKADSRPSKA